MASRVRFTAPGHALTTEWNGETGPESMCAGTCACGEWSETTSSRRETTFEYRCHIARVHGYTNPRAYILAKSQPQPAQTAPPTPDALTMTYGDPRVLAGAKRLAAEENRHWDRADAFHAHYRSAAEAVLEAALVPDLLDALRAAEDHLAQMQTFLTFETPTAVGTHKANAAALARVRAALNPALEPDPVCARCDDRGHETANCWRH